eukprot:scaffold93526_cov33-Tisochrysis_lutea.AAC.1
MFYYLVPFFLLRHQATGYYVFGRVCRYVGSHDRNVIVAWGCGFGGPGTWNVVVINYASLSVMAGAAGWAGKEEGSMARSMTL